ncbi:transcription factor TFIIIB component B'' homolog isoform X2 [Pecten maximus]|uniref:transcription factor TFIIIB component B'' homolog isoform X2 n=2 Tax=Pecten maximus TaxID=6579 RepID=UPI00145854A3|nr:transcription factor TFIIIB component B'' homolog isoform X2 [Pecten maximus]
MSVLQVYLSWANSVLRDAGQEMKDIGEIQQGVVLCQLIDNLDRSARLVRKQQLSGSEKPEEYIQAAIDHMRKNGVKVSFSTQDLLDKDVKSMLDALWLIILNFCIHPIERGVFQRSVGIGKKHILEWCQQQLGADFDPRNTLAYNLCTGDWFIKLLQKHTGISNTQQEDKTDQVKTLLEVADEKLSVEQGIINPSEVVDGTIDEHTLMIYISLLQRKVGGNDHVENGDHHQDISEQGLIQNLELHHIPNGNAHDDQLSATSGSISLTSGYSPSDSDRRDCYSDRRSPSRDRSTTSGYSGTSGQSDLDRRERGSDRLKDSFDRKQRKVSPGSPGLQRPRSHRVIMAEMKGKLEAEQRRKEREEAERQRKEEDERRRKARLEMGMSRDMGGTPGNRVSSDEERRVAEGSSLGGSSFAEQPQLISANPQLFQGMGGVPIFVMPSQGPQAMLLLQALQQARQEANFHDTDKYSSSQQTLPKLHTLLDLDDVDEYSPIVTSNGGESLEYVGESPAKFSGSESPRRESPRRESPRRESPRRESPRRESPRRESPRRESPSPRRESPRRESPRRESPRRESPRRGSPGRESPRRSGSPEFRPNKRGILEVVHDPLELKEEVTDLSTTGSEAEQRRFPRVDLTEPVKAIIEKERKSPRDRSRSKSPRERRSLTPGTSDNEDMTDKSLEDETTPKSILRNKLSSPERASRHDNTIPGGTFEKLRPDRSPSLGRRSSPDRSYREHSSGERSPAYPLSDGEETSGTRDNSPGRSTNNSDPNRRLVRVLNRELELLRLKMDVLERANMSEDTDLENLESVTTKLSEKVKETLSKATSSPKRRQSPEPHRGRKSPDYERGRMFLKKGIDSPPRSNSDNRPSRRRPSPDRTLDSPRSHSVGDKIHADLDGQMTFSPITRGKPINLGYTSPIRNVSEEIWGIDLSDLDSGFDPDRMRKWKKLASIDNVTDREAVQLKQGLASAVSEIDILQAKLNNANAEIQAKMSKTSDVLNDCRSHLGKAQAENMELRTQLEKERIRNDTLENRIRDADSSLHAAKSANDDLEAELGQTRALLKGASKKDIPTLQSLMEERDRLLEVLATTQKENTRLLQNADQSKKRIRKGQSTVNDLRGILDEAIKERRQLYDEIKRLQTEGQLSQVSGIIGKYMEKGLYDMEERQQHLNGYVTRSRSNSDISQPSVSELHEEEIQRPISPSPLRRSVSPVNVSKHPKRSTSPSSKYTDSVERVKKSHGSLALLNVTNSPSKCATFNMSGISTNHSLDDDIDDEYNYEDISPSVPSNFREIYPHRRSRSYKNNFSSSMESDGRRSPSDYEDMEVQKLMAEQQQPIRRLDFDKDLDDSYLTRAPKKDFHHQRSRSPGAMDISELRDHRKPVRRQLYYNSPNRNAGGDGSNKIYLAKHDGRELIESIIESPVDNRFRDVSPRDTTPPARRSQLDVDIDNSNKIFIEALNSAVQQENGKRYFDDFDIKSPKSPMDTRNTILSSSLGQEKERQRSQSPGLKGILKSTKGEQNMSIKEGFPQYQRSLYSRSVSPVRSPRSMSPRSRSPRSKSPTNSGIGKPLFSSGAPKRSGIVRNPSDLFSEDSLSSPGRFMSPSAQYHHTPLRFLLGVAKFADEQYVESKVTDMFVVSGSDSEEH